MTMYFESDYDKNLREQRANNVVKDYGIWVRPKVGGVKQETDAIKNNLYCCKEPIQQLVYLAKYAHTHDNLLPEYKDLMSHYATQIERVMGWKL